MNVEPATRKCPACGFVRVAADGALAAECPRCAQAATRSAPTAPPISNPRQALALIEHPAIGRFWASWGQPLGWVAAVIMAVTAINKCSSSSTAPPSQSGIERLAPYACRSAVERTLHDPDSAKWGQAYTIGNQTQMELRAKNLMGAYRLSTVTCTFDRATGAILSYDVK